MGRFTFEETRIPGVIVVTPAVFGDSRGYFMETYNSVDFASAGIDAVFVQDNQSKSSRGVLRGLHFQTGEHSQAKLVRVVSGEVFDVAVDLRPGSATYGQWVGAVLSAESRCQLFIPKHFAHGFLVLSDSAEFTYKCDAPYCPSSEAGLAWDDPEVGIEWPLPAGLEPILSAKDIGYPRLGDIEQ